MWISKAFCAYIDPELFYPKRETVEYIEDNLPCKYCPMQRECRNYSIIYDEFGIWGGLTRKQRNRIANKKSIYSRFKEDTIRDRLTDIAITEHLIEWDQVRQDVKQYLLYRKYLVKKRTLSTQDKS